MESKVYQIELIDKNGVLHIPYDLYSFQVFKSREKAEQWAEENLYDSEKEMTMTIKEYSGKDIEDFVIIDEEPIEPAKKVYCVFVESNWHNGEEFSDVAEVFDNKNSALIELQTMKSSFINMVSDKLCENIMESENYTIIDEDVHFQCIDEGMGYSYELWVLEKDLKS